MPPVVYKRQRQVLEYINQYIEKWGFSPSLKEIAKAIGVGSLATVSEHLDIMMSKGLIKRAKGSIRAIDVIDTGSERIKKGIELPVMGFIAAGLPIEPHSDPNASLDVPPSLISGQSRAYVLQVKGESMIEDGILDGDYVIIEEQETAKDGDIVVALLENGFATLKRFFKETTRVRLEPANSQMAPIFATNVRIQGRVTAVVRKY